MTQQQKMYPYPLHDVFAIEASALLADNTMTPEIARLLVAIRNPVIKVYITGDTDWRQRDECVRLLRNVGYDRHVCFQIRQSEFGKFCSITAKIDISQWIDTHGGAMEEWKLSDNADAWRLSRLIETLIDERGCSEVILKNINSPYADHVVCGLKNTNLDIEQLGVIFTERPIGGD